MHSTDLLGKLFDYDHWANREALASLSTVPGDAARGLKLFGHIIGAQQVCPSADGFEDPHPSNVQPWPAATDYVVYGRQK